MLRRAAPAPTCPLADRRSSGGSGAGVGASQSQSGAGMPGLGAEEPSEPRQIPSTTQTEKSAPKFRQRKLTGNCLLMVHSGFT
ncbi:hypothetical protein Y1Q_0016386 [Alligator mississippiensis]|uniref:Uncharacterized protein n=1 Tax=Alligator mississippiensis TaxID=8496 RepID=A0A151N2F5_ALLMI|nr:hypothetical protein Y1Q_0016386 [Alligator mississippiensis]